MKISITVITMATPVIKLEPIRMGSLVSTSSPLAPGQKYLPPNMRTENTSQPVKVDLGVNNFPTLGSVAKKVSGWGKHVIHAVKTTVIPEEVVMPAVCDITTMKDKIKEQIRQAELEEEERQKPREEDPYKMTREELKADGWSILSLKPEAVRKAAFSLNTPFKVALTSEDYYE